MIVRERKVRGGGGGRDRQTEKEEGGGPERGYFAKPYGTLILILHWESCSCMQKASIAARYSVLLAVQRVGNRYNSQMQQIQSNPVKCS